MTAIVLHLEYPDEPVPFHGCIRTGGLDIPRPGQYRRPWQWRAIRPARKPCTCRGRNDRLLPAAGARWLGRACSVDALAMAGHGAARGRGVFLLYMSWKLASHDGQLGNEGRQRATAAWQGAAMQWLNPKAWLAAVAGVGAYTGGEQQLLWLFTGIYGPICFVSVASWAWAGSVIREYVSERRYMRLLNRSLALLLVISAGYLVI